MNDKVYDEKRKKKSGKKKKKEIRLAYRILYRVL